MSSIEQQLGHIKGSLDAQREDLKYIRANMVHRREFDARVAEHVEFRADIAALKEIQDRHHISRDTMTRFRWAGIGVLVAAVAKLVGLA